MAKIPSGLPEGFDLKVTAEDLAGPASLPGYLDDDPVITFANLQKQQAQQKNPEAKKLVETFQQPPPQVKNIVEMPKVSPQEVSIHEVPEKAPQKAVIAPIERKRLQVNLDVESERMLEEMLDLLSSQSSENKIKISELFQALLMTLYSAKGEIALGSLPTRGRWGSATAKAFPVNLAESLREAIVNHEKQSGGSPFKKVVGG